MNNEISKQLEDEIATDLDKLIGPNVIGPTVDAVKDMIISKIKRERYEYYVRGYDEAIFELQGAIDKMTPKRFVKERGG